MAFLEVIDVSVVYGTNLILNKVSFSIEQGEVVSIVGPNGTGKSTLVKAILGLVSYKGEVLFEGKKITKSTALFGYVPQRFEFDITFPITVREFLSLRHSNLDSSDGKELLHDLLVDGFLEKKLGSLSGGQLQRVLIAQALLAKPKILIFDEPTTGVDEAGVHNFYEIIDHLNREHNITIVLISHETDVVYRLSDKVVCLDKQSYHVELPKKGSAKDLFNKTHHDDRFKPTDHH